MANLTREHARRIVDSIRVNNGGIEASDREKTPKPPNTVFEFTEFAYNSSNLAKELYTTPARFVFELIQNAEDNQYKRAYATGTDPYLHFLIDRDKIVIDSNEDGFLEENVNAICKISTSTKNEVRGYIGEKGIGFKSVFKVASRVHVQSGPFSFSFNHGGGDDENGMGMVTPSNDIYEDLPGDVRTRFTLTLKDDPGFERLVKEFADLPDTLLLFLITLKRLKISVNGSDEVSETNYEYKYEESSGKGLLTRKPVGGEPKNFDFYISKKLIQKLPIDEARKDVKEAQVVLAFPVDGEDVPIVEQQYVFAYLPIRKVGFFFLIQSDFITQASREDVLHSEWNQNLLLGTAEVFVDAILRFSSHPILQYMWLRYLPRPDIADPYWTQLRGMIVRSLKDKPILRPWSGGVSRCISQLKMLPKGFLDENREPLFRDLAEEIYLSDEYPLEDKRTLQAIGVELIGYHDLFKRVKADLESPSSMTKNFLTSQSWHTRSARMMLDAAKDRLHLKSLCALKMLPLRDGSWTSVAQGGVHYPQIGEVDIPQDLGLRLLAPESLFNSTRRKLFDKLGLESCDPMEVKKLIVSKYNKWNGVDLASSVSHIHFLFYHYPKEEGILPETVVLFDAQEQPIYRVRVTLGRDDMIVDDLYFDSASKYDVKKLCAKRRDSNGWSSKRVVHIINPAYMDFDGPASLPHNLSWSAWLQKYAEILPSPRLVNRNKPLKPSDLFLWIVEYRRDSVLGILKTHWHTYCESMSQEIVAFLQRVKIVCVNGENVRLKDTLVPLPKLVKIAKDLKVHDRMRFMKLPPEFESESVEGWLFLELLGVGVAVDLNFYLQALRALRNLENENSMRLIVLRVYDAIEERARVDNYKHLRNFFQREIAIHVMDDEEDGYTWAAPTECVWQAPGFLNISYVLAKDDDFRRNEKIRRLVTRVLEIKDGNWRYYLDQLDQDKSCNLEDYDVSRPSSIYSVLGRDVTDSDEWEQISEVFHNKGLIFVLPQKEWHSQCECLWSESTHISGKFPIAAQYPHLQDFFVERLGVSMPTLEIHVEELLSLCNNATNIPFEQIKGLIREIDLWKPVDNNVQELKDKHVLPVNDKHGRKKLMTPNDTFAIVDRQKYGDIFTRKVASLDFALEEVRSIKTFLSALGLNNRYMSHLANETSEVGDAVEEVTLSEDFRRRAYALVRCANYFESSQAEDGGHDLLRKLMGATVYQTDEITKMVSLKLYGRDIAKQSTIGTLHIEEDDSGLKLYVPKGRKDQVICFFTQLPERLVSHWAISDRAAVKVIGDALTASTYALDGILLEHGISEIPGLRPAEDAEPGEERNDYIGATSRLSETITARATNSSAKHTSPLALSWEATAPTGSADSQSRATTPEEFNFSAQPKTIEAGDIVNRSHASEYKALLDRVVRAAEDNVLPPYEIFANHTSDSTDPTAATADSDILFGVRSQDAIAHDMKIGAAGELYAFEILHSYGCPSFDIENWRSRIRHYVRVHHKYQDLEPWKGRETADIVYEDCKSKLTAILIKCGYLSRYTWNGKKPTYYLEVKTTTGPCETRFFMSKAQVKRMKEMRLESRKASLDIYIILRVYNLTSDNIGMRILVDPATMELNKELVFTAENYTVLQQDAPVPDFNLFGTGT